MIYFLIDSLISQPVGTAMMSAACICNHEKEDLATSNHSSANSFLHHPLGDKSEINPYLMRKRCFQIRGDWIEIIKIDGL